MSTVPLPAVAGHLPHGWLAALGLTRLLAETWPGLALTWDRQWAHPVLVGGPTSREDVVAAARAVLDALPDGAVLPGVDPGHPAAGARPGAGLLAPWAGPDGETWRRALIAPSGDLHPLIRPHAAQTLAGMLRAMTKALRGDPGLLDAAIAGPGHGLTDTYGAGLWILRSTGSRPAASPGLDWLAVMAVPWMPVVETATPAGLPVTAAVGWPLDPSGRPTLSWSLWHDPIPAAELPEHLAAADADPAPRYRWQRHRNTRTDPPMLVPLDGSPLTRGHPAHADHDPGSGFERVELWLPTRVLADVDRLCAQNDAIPDPDSPGPVTRDEVIAALLEGAVLEAIGRPRATGGTAMERLAAYATAREQLHDNLREAAAELLAAGVPERGLQAQLARQSGLTRQWVAKVLAVSPPV